MGSREVALKLSGVTKRFGDLAALESVDLTLRSGTVHALAGMNGSGKSTIVKILSGFYSIDDGAVEHAAASRVGFVHQDLALIDSMTVTDNLSLDHEPPMRAGVIDRRAERRRAQRLLEPFGLPHLADSLISDLTKAEATIVAIARALGDEPPEVLILDEPTSTLPEAQTDQLLQVMRTCAESGVAILFITHRLTEILNAADEVTVLRNGRVAFQGPTSQLTLPELADYIGSPETGDRIELGDDTWFDRETPILTARGLSGKVIEGFDLDVHRGEIVGIVGLLGSGVEEIGGLLSGRRTGRGAIEIDTPSGQSGMGYVPADRARNAVLSGLTGRENGAIAALTRFLHFGALSSRAESEAMTEAFERMTVYPLQPELPMSSFSGGNQQKILFARWMVLEPDVLIAEEPTQGIDIRAKAQILDQLRRFAVEGRAVILTTGEPEEIQSACDRLLVVEAGRLKSELRAPFTRESILLALHERSIHGEHS